MINKRHSTVLLVFTTLSAVIMYFALSYVRAENKVEGGNIALEEDFSFFKELNYYLSAEGKKKISLVGDSLTIYEKQGLDFVNPKGTLYGSKDEAETINYSAKSGQFNPESGELALVGNVSFDSSRGFKHSSELLTYEAKKKFLAAKGDVRSNITNQKTADEIVIDSQEMKSWFDKKEMEFDGGIKAVVKRKRNYEGSLVMTAKSMHLNMLKSLASFSGGITLKRNNYYLHANKAEMFLENFNKRLKYYVLYDDIKLEERLRLSDGTTSLRRAFSEKLEGYMGEGKIVLSGTPQVEQDGDLIKGYQITLRENVELVEVDDSQTRFNIERGN